jgi:hypothetical protein
LPRTPVSSSSDRQIRLHPDPSNEYNCLLHISLGIVPNSPAHAQLGMPNPAPSGLEYPSPATRNGTPMARMAAVGSSLG